jgi:hypothetical protein
MQSRNGHIDHSKVIDWIRKQRPRSLEMTASDESACLTRRYSLLIPYSDCAVLISSDQESLLSANYLHRSYWRVQAIHRRVVTR